MKPTDQYMKEWQKIVNDAHAMLKSTCPLIEDEVIIDINDYLRHLESLTQWIPVSTQLPKSKEFVLIAFDRYAKKPVVTMGYWIERYSVLAGGYRDEEMCEYNDEEDEYYLTQGWRDCSLESEWHYPIDGVTHWAPLPNHPSREIEK